MASFGLETKVVCPSCRKSFAYRFIPGGFLTSMRLGRYRYMKCRKCKKFAKFDILMGIDKGIKKHIIISQFANSITLGMLGISSYIISGSYQYITVGYFALRLVATISILLAIIILVGLYIYVERDEE
jgi:hypothetical protein